MKQNAVTPAMSIALAAACAATTVSCSGTGVFRQVMDLPEQTNVSRSDHAVAASAEQISGEPGSPSARIAIDGK